MAAQGWEPLRRLKVRSGKCQCPAPSTIIPNWWIDIGSNIRCFYPDAHPPLASGFFYGVNG